MGEFARAKSATPILNSPYFDQVFGGEDGTSLPLDGKGLLRAVETIAFPGTKFTILERLGSHIFRVSTEEYPSDTPLYVDLRFLEQAHPDTPERKRTLPSKEKILNSMKALVGATYIWGGNWSAGIPQLLSFYPPGKELDQVTQTLWSLQGVDCSGLLYEATNGCTPRNTAQLVHFGKAIENTSGKSSQALAALLQPLDLIVWKGHVLIALDKENLIESRHGKGVIITPTTHRLDEIMQERQPTDHPETLTSSHFLLRRWAQD